MSFEPLHAQGAVCRWGTTEFHITSLSVSNSAGQEIDITSMSSQVTTDPDDTKRNFIAQDFDCAFSAQGGGEIAIEFLADNSIGDPWSCVGYKRLIDIKAGQGAPGQFGHNFFWLGTAILTQVQAQLSTGDFIKGSAVFKLSKN